ncbi:MAG: type II toxin-antitoxin system RelB/DinJ family antitoxin [bacterium]
MQQLNFKSELNEQEILEFKKICIEIGLTMDMLVRAVIRAKGTPFEFKLNEPNEKTYSAMEEAEQMIINPNALKFSNVDDLFKELDS